MTLHGFFVCLKFLIITFGLIFGLKWLVYMHGSENRNYRISWLIIFFIMFILVSVLAGLLGDY